jgi:type VI secretion system protein ImpA
MMLLDELLKPVPGPNPAGKSLKYARIYDKIKEARREEDDAPQGEWVHERKVADWKQVIKLASEALAMSKDLQLAVWLTEAALQTEGFAGLQSGMDLLRGMIEKFWDHLYPDIEDGDLALRVAPLDWIGTRLERPIKEVPLTRRGFDYFGYKESLRVGHQEDTGGDVFKVGLRNTAIEEGKLTAEEFDEALFATPKSYYQDLLSDLDAAIRSAEALRELCEGKFGDQSPQLSPMVDFLTDVRHSAKALLVRKMEIDPDTEGTPVEPLGEQPPEGAPHEVRIELQEPPTPIRESSIREPTTRDDAMNQLVVVISFLRREDPFNPASYLLLRALRWGDLRAAGHTPDPNLFEAPTTQIRHKLKRLAANHQWLDLLEAAELTMGEPCGRAWLDLQRYVVHACEKLGTCYEGIARAIKSELKALLEEFPLLPKATLTDDTPTANAETQIWLNESVCTGANTEFMTLRGDPPDHEADADRGSFDLASKAAKEGRKQESIEILTDEIMRQQSGRGRFLCKLRLAELCLSMGHEAMARSVLEELAQTVERHRLEEWESPHIIAHILSLLYGTLEKIEADPIEKRQLYARICRLDPKRALSHSA